MLNNIKYIINSIEAFFIKEGTKSRWMLNLLHTRHNSKYLPLNAALGGDNILSLVVRNSSLIWSVIGTQCKTLVLSKEASVYLVLFILSE